MVKFALELCEKLGS